MNREILDANWLDEDAGYTLLQLIELSGLARAEVLLLVEYSVLAPMEPDTAQPRFSVDSVALARAAQRLRDDFELDVDALALMMTLLKRVRELESRLEEMSARVPRGVL